MTSSKMCPIAEDLQKCLVPERDRRAHVRVLMLASVPGDGTTIIAVNGIVRYLSDTGLRERM